MINFPLFLLALKKDDDIFLAFSDYYLEGKVIDFDEIKTFIKLSSVKVSGNPIDEEITLYSKNLFPVGWGKKE